MRTLTVDETLSWISATGLRADLGECVSLPETGFKFSVRLPKFLPYRTPYFASLFLPGSYQKSDRFLFWSHDNGASGELAFEIAIWLFKLFRMEQADNRPILETPGYLFEAGEGVDAQAFTTMAVLFSWGAYILPQNGTYFVWIDDDEFADIGCMNKQDFEQLKARFSEWGVLE
jgi:hypothetical protein